MRLLRGCLLLSLPALAAYIVARILLGGLEVVVGPAVARGVVLTLGLLTVLVGLWIWRRHG